MWACKLSFVLAILGVKSTRNLLSPSFQLTYFKFPYLLLLTFFIFSFPFGSVLPYAANFSSLQLYAPEWVPSDGTPYVDTNIVSPDLSGRIIVGTGVVCSLLSLLPFFPFFPSFFFFFFPPVSSQSDDI
jgi:hypothetical protein